MSFFGRVGNLARGMWKTMGGPGPDDGREAALDDELRRDAGRPAVHPPDAARARGGARPAAPLPEEAPPVAPDAPPEREPDGSVKRTL